MGQTLTIEVPDGVYATVVRSATGAGVAPESFLSERISALYPPRPALTPEEEEAAWQELLSHAGAASLGYATGLDNDSIDADLAREYEFGADA